MHIMIIASWYPESERDLNGSFFRDRAIALATAGCQVSVAVANVHLRLSSHHPGIYVTDSAGVAEYRSYRRNLTPFSEAGIALQQISMIRRIYERICQEQGKPDIIHLESARCAPAAVRLASEEGLPLVYMEHYSRILTSKPGSYLDKLAHRAIDAASCVFLISSAMERRLAVPPDQAVHIPNAVDFSQFSLSRPEKPFTFCTLGSLRHVKGYDLLLRAFAQVRRLFGHCRLVIGGEGEEATALKTLCRELELEDAVTFAGRISPENRSRFLSPASAFVCSSRVETFSIVIVEALACGIPVVATRCGGPEDLVNESNGILVERDSIPALAQGLWRMLEHRSDYDSDTIREAARSKYDRDNVIRRQIECYQALLSRQKER